MDVLSDVLGAVKFEGALFFHGEFSAPWCIRSPRSVHAARYLHPKSEHVVIYHFLTEGRAFARLSRGDRVELTAGDVVIFPHGDAHFLGNGSPEKPVDSFRTFAGNLTQGLKIARFGGGGETTRFICGYMACEPALSQVVLAGLPKMLRVPVLRGSSGRWLADSIRFSVEEAGSSSPGGRLILSKLSELLFMETLRRYLNNLPPGQTGWLAGARDHVVGLALSTLHNSPAHAWTVAELARRVGTSRTRLAERFRQLLGESPMAYLARWRLMLGAERLQSTGESVEEIALAVGYGSAAAFHRAFHRLYDCPPAQFRRKYNASASVPDESRRDPDR